MSTEVRQLLATLMPTGKQYVMDLLKQAGHDVSSWYVTGAGQPVKTPRANPAYCYDWAFGSETTGFVVCVWHDSLRMLELPAGAAIVYQENIREHALALDRIAIDRTRPVSDRNRARDQAKRGRAFDRVLQIAFRRGLPVRLIVNQGNKRGSGAELGKTTSSVALRQLDAESWYVHAYDDATGDTLVVRGISKLATDGVVTADGDHVKAVQSVLPVPVFVDQFSEPIAAIQREVTVIVRHRSAAVRDRVLRRANGMCELCGREGFVTSGGSIYLETHHVLPLAADGPDHESNMVALCPDDHRRSHFAADRESMGATLTALLQSMAIPDA